VEAPLRHAYLRLRAALGIGANTAIFSMAEAFLVHPVPIDGADRILALVVLSPITISSPPRGRSDLSRMAAASPLL